MYNLVIIVSGNECNGWLNATESHETPPPIMSLNACLSTDKVELIELWIMSYNRYIIMKQMYMYVCSRILGLKNAETHLFQNFFQLCHLLREGGSHHQILREDDTQGE